VSRVPIGFLSAGPTAGIAYLDFPSAPRVYRSRVRVLSPSGSTSPLRLGRLLVSLGIPSGSSAAGGSLGLRILLRTFRPRDRLGSGLYPPSSRKLAMVGLPLGPPY